VDLDLPAVRDTSLSLQRPPEVHGPAPAPQLSRGNRSDGPTPAAGPWSVRPIRVVYLDHIARLSGGEIALLRLLPALAGAVDAHVILGEDGPLVERLRAVDISVEVLPMAPRVRDLRRDEVTSTGLDPASMPDLARYLLALRSRLRILKPDLVHTNSLKAALYGGLAGRLAGIPVIWHVRDRIAPDYLPRSAVRLVHLAARVLPRAVVANSTATLATLPRLGQAEVLYNPIVPDVIPRPRSGSSARTNGLRIGMVGRLAQWKGQHVFLEAFARAFPHGDETARIVGGPLFGEQQYERHLRSQAEWLGIADRVEWRGFQEDVFAELAELDVLVHCSITPEPFGQVVVEGMAAGLPVIATDQGGPAEIIRDGVDGLLVPPSDVLALVERLRQVAADPALRARLGESARASSRRFSPEAARAQLLEVYREVVTTAV
jgi:glycosyltransferase involved in cell wall biosynthesis